MFILTILEKKDFRKKIKETRLKFSQGSATVLKNKNTLMDIKPCQTQL